ncbi:hypothetical protein [Chryseobacterium polytrichastri]|uniref:Uncharacterized protein n=2 Tax=Chryseobacterium TaxID=59732 RepID=A0A1M6SF60_9FLAO|nr:hypothetical protein [Chryseobacterium polytrichastri]SHK43373.1 hypothetical protein SAMN05444267_100412 [Chryseobacterium polytrichastri]
MEHLNKTTGLILKNEKYVGGSVIFPWGEELLCITAGHNLYGKNFDEIPNLEEWSVSDYLGNCHGVRECLGDIDHAKEYDIIVLKLNSKEDLSLYLCPCFYTIPRNPKHSFLFRGKYESANEPILQKNLSFNVVCQDSIHKFLCDIDKEKLINSSFKTGSTWLSGWSGSGLFLDNHDELICFGVMIEIPNDGNDGQLKFTSVTAIDILGLDLKTQDSTLLNYDKKLSKNSLTSIIDQTTDEAISNWEKEPINKPQLDYINLKLPKVYQDKLLEEKKNYVIKRLIVGQTFLSSELRKNQSIFDCYDEAYKVYNLVDKEIDADSKKEARIGLNNMISEYEDYLKDQIGELLNVAEVKTLALYGISNWIANCSLSFTEDE